VVKYFLLVKVFSRAKGSRVTRAAAYRAGERIRDERTSESYNYSDRKDIVHSEIILPDGVARSSDIEWARNRAKLWNAAEHVGTRRNSRLGREVLVILPPEISAAGRTQLARRFAVELSEKYRNAVDFAVHEPRAGSDERHHHAHLLMTTREVTPKGLGTRTILDLSGTERRARGLGPSKTDLLWIRERWAELTNQALSEAGISQRVDHRSYRLQGLDRDPAVALPQKVFYAERQHGRSAAGDAIRARHRERADARQQGDEAFRRVVQKQKDEARREVSLRGPKRHVPHGALNRDELNELRRQRYQGNKDAINDRRRQSQREWVRVDGDTQKSRLELRREKWRQQFQAMSEDQREQVRAKARERYRERVAKEKQHTPTAEEAVRNWLEYRKSHGAGPTAEQSVQNWLAYRNGQRSSDTSTLEDEQSNTQRRDDRGLSL
jgi:MobA/MobL family